MNDDNRLILDTWTAEEAYAIVGLLERLACLLYHHHDTIISPARRPHVSDICTEIVAFIESAACDIWSSYGHAIATQCFAHPADHGDQRQLSLPLPMHFDDDIPF